MHRKRAGSFAMKEESVPSVHDDTTSISRRGSRIVYPPLVSSMVRSNTMRDCHQIQAMFLQCQMDSISRNENGGDTKNEPFVCRTAKKYHEMCLSREQL